MNNDIFTYSSKLSSSLETEAQTHEHTLGKKFCGNKNDDKKLKQNFFMDLCKQNIKELPSKISTMETTNAKGEVGKNYLWLKLVYFQRNSNVPF